VCDKLEQLHTRERHEKNRRSDIAHHMRELKKRSLIPTLYALAENGIENPLQTASLEEVAKHFEKVLGAIDVFLDKHEAHAPVYRATLNYFTLNKRPKEWIEEKVIKELKFLTEKLPAVKTEYDNARKKQAEQKTKFFESLQQENGYQLFRAKQKDVSLFSECTETDFKAMRNLTKEIECLAVDIENAKKRGDEREVSEKRVKSRGKRKKRGEYFNKIESYVQFCKDLENKSTKYGQLRAKVDSLKKEKIDAERVDAWAVCLCDMCDKKTYLATFDRGCAYGAYKTVSAYTETQQGTWMVRRIESLTLQALDKLCFGTQKNTFIEGVAKEMKRDEEGNDYHRFLNKYGKCKRKDELGKKGEEVLITFYKAVIDIASKNHTLPSIQFFTHKDTFLKEAYTELPQFQEALKKACYTIKDVRITEEEKERLLKEHNGALYHLTNFDIEADYTEGAKKRREERRKKHQHTILWEQFWGKENADQHYATRINPEVTFFAKQQQETSRKDKKGGEVQRNRRKEAYGVVSFTITEHAHHIEPPLPFRSEEEVKQEQETYNVAYNNALLSARNTSPVYILGVDKGEKQLATIGLYTYDDDEKNPDSMQPAPFVFYRIPQDKITESVYKNPSLHFDMSDAEVCSSSCLDITKAKVIGGKIVENGDIATFLRFKEFAIKRTLYEHATRGTLCSDPDKWKWDNTHESSVCVLKIPLKNKQNLEYRYDANAEQYGHNSKDKEAFLKELREYAKRVQKGNFLPDAPFVSIDEFNHVRDALCANMVGVLRLLLERCREEAGNNAEQSPLYIAFENLSQEEKGGDHMKSNKALHSRLEWKVLQKLRMYNMVPQRITQIMQQIEKNPDVKKRLEEKGKKKTQKNCEKKRGGETVLQVGAVLYVPTSGTSSTCPCCKKESCDSDAKRKNIFKCKTCGFCTTNKVTHEGARFEKRECATGKNLSFLEDSDQVATYNIARSGMHHLIESQKNNTPPQR
jgi:hypothetical protein